LADNFPPGLKSSKVIQSLDARVLFHIFVSMCIIHKVHSLSFARRCNWTNDENS